MQGNDPVCPDVEREGIAEAVRYVASDESRWTTGSILTVDGGMSDLFPTMFSGPAGYSAPNRESRAVA